MIPGLEYKVCSKCKENLPKFEFFRHPAAPDGYQYICRHCVNAANRLRAKDRAKDRSDYNAKWYQDNRAKVKESQRKCRERREDLNRQRDAKRFNEPL